MNAITEKYTTKQLESFHLKKFSAFSTWYKYKSIYFPNIYLKRLKEDCCDTCMKYKIALEDSTVSSTDKDLIKAALEVSIVNTKVICIMLTDLLVI